MAPSRPAATDIRSLVEAATRIASDPITVWVPVAYRVPAHRIPSCTSSADLAVRTPVRGLREEGQDRLGRDGRKKGMKKLSLIAVARHLRSHAATASSGRSAETVYGGHDQVLRQTLIALQRGRSMGEHDSPGEGTVYVLHGRIRLSTGDTSWDARTGDLVIIPRARHRIDACEDSTVLLTVAKS